MEKTTQCTQCGWRGTDEQKIDVKQPDGMGLLTCPECGCGEFYLHPEEEDEGDAGYIYLTESNYVAAMRQLLLQVKIGDCPAISADDFLKLDLLELRLKEFCMRVEQAGVFTWLLPTDHETNQVLHKYLKHRLSLVTPEKHITQFFPDLEFCNNATEQANFWYAFTESIMQQTAQQIKK